MDSFLPLSSILLVLIAILAFTSLITTRRTLNALLLLVESGILVIYYLMSESFTSMAPLALMLCLLCLIILSATMYLEKTFQVITPSRSTYSVIMGALFFLFFAFTLDHLKGGMTKVYEPELFPQENNLGIFAVLFIILSILISANAILSTKHND